jgi:ABC-type antimicrobial peptide transport system permease subunit
MEDLIFVLPTLIIFFFIIFQILAFFKRAFNLIRKKLNLTIEDAGEEFKKRTSQVNQSYDQEEVKDRIAEAEKESLSESKERILKSTESDSKSIKDKKTVKDNINEQKKSKKSSSLGEIFADYNEVEKAVIYNEILSKPKALKKD